MSNIQVKNVDPAMHEQLRERAAAANMPLSDYVLELIRRDLRTPPRHQWLAAVRTLPTIATDLDVGAGLDEARGERDR